MNLSIKNLFNRLQRKANPVRIVTTGMEGEGNPFSSALDQYTVGLVSFKMYEALRELPIFDNAVNLLNTLIGDFEIESKDHAIVDELNDFKQNVPVNYILKGFFEWRRQHWDSCLTFGRAFGETLPSVDLSSGVAGLFNYQSSKVRVEIDKGKPKLYQLRDTALMWEEVNVPNWDLINFTLNQTRGGDLNGRSLFVTMPFVAKILVRILDCIGKVYYRIGDPTFLIMVKGDQNTEYKSMVDAEQKLSTALNNVWRDRKQLGIVRDVTGALPRGADLIIEMLGKEGSIVSEKVPITAVLEQIATGIDIPLFLLNIHSESSTYKLTTHQADKITARIDYMRMLTDPIINKIFQLHLILKGMTRGTFKHHWKSIMLLDEVETAKARQINAMAEKNIIETLILLKENNAINEDEFFQNVIEAGIIKAGKAALVGTNGVSDYFKMKIKHNTLVNLIHKVRNGEITSELENN